MQQLHGGRAASIVASVVTALATVSGAALIASVPLASLGAGLILVGIGMMSTRRLCEYFRAGWLSKCLVLTTASATLVLGVMGAITLGVGLACVVHFIRFSRVDVAVSLRDQELRLHVRGLLFFVSASRLQRQIKRRVDEVPTHLFANVVVDLREARVYAPEHVELDWLRHLLNKAKPMTLICNEEQRDAIRSMRATGAMPSACVVVYGEFAEQDIAQAA